MRSSTFVKSILIACLVCVPHAYCDDAASAKLAPYLDALLKIANGNAERFTLAAEGDLLGNRQNVKLLMGREAPRRFFITVDASKDLKVTIVLTPERLFVDLPAKQIAFVADGPLPEGAEALKPDSIFAALPSLNPLAKELWPLLANDGKTLAGALDPLLGMTLAAPATQDLTKIGLHPVGSKDTILLTLQSGEPARWNLSITHPGKDARVVELCISKNCLIPVLPADHKILPVPRAELERVLQRGSLRAIEIEAGDMNAQAPVDKVTEIPGARLEIKNGQRTCWLSGTPREMGREHGKLLAHEARQITDSTLYVVGSFYSVAQGRWFLSEIRDAWKRLEPHCDRDYLEELKGLAEGSNISEEELTIANVFPELFHCSGFAIAGEATVGGKLFHGRVLDYMTQIGLQHSQVDFITKKAGRHGVVNVGYAGFIGCVSGMNDAQISLGEMGGRGEGHWDGTPMAFLMRDVLEHAGTLDEARDIFQNAKRTCEYYYVIADGKTRTALGVAAWPDKIQFLKQGESHPLLPNALPGCVLLSADERYKLLNNRTRENYGKIDEAAALELMSRPVAMGSNLHCVLFVPEDQIYFVAHASLQGHHPAAMQKYVKHNLKENLAILERLAVGKETSQR